MGKFTVKIGTGESLDYSQTKEKISRGYPAFVDNVPVIWGLVICRP